jgi:hypothetical protein
MMILTKCKQIFISCLLLLGSIAQSEAQSNAVRLLDASGTQMSIHNSILAAYQAIPNPMSGAVVVEITATYTGIDEVLPLVLTARQGASSSNTITIRPGAGVPNLNHTANVASTGLITLDGASWVVLDGRAGGQGSTRAWSLNSTATNANTVSLINGATHNIIRYLTLENGGSGGASRCVQIGTSATNPVGNSFNLVEHCFLSGSRYGINVNGTAANPNRKNVLRKNEISTAVFTGIWIQSGTAGITIDSNLIYSTNTAGSGPFGILFDAQSDTAIVRNNHIFDINNAANSSQVRGICFRTTQSGGLDNYSEVYNNFVALNMPNSGSINLIGIEYAGVNFINAKVYHNTVVVGGMLNSGGTAGNIVSSAFSRAPNSSNVANQFDVRNNIFVNTRTGGNAGVHHLAVAVANTEGVNQFNYNTYGSAADLGRVGTTAYNLLADYVTAIGGGNEVNSNTAAVVTVSATDLSLSGSSLGNQLLGAPFIPLVTTDIFSQVRSMVTVYRGAHEAIPSLGSNCTGNPVVGVASANSLNLCTGDSLTLSLSIPTDPELLYVWQSAPIGSSNFSNISGATVAPFSTIALQPMQYRCIAHCPVSNERDTSNVLVTSLVPVLGAFSIQSSAVGATYTFTANAGSAVTAFSWNFDDGNTDTGRVVTHTFTANRLHIVQLRASNSCFEDSVGLAVNVINVSVKEQEGKLNSLVYPNPATDLVNVSTGFETVSIKVLNTWGAVVAQYVFEPSKAQRLDISALATGCIICKCKEVMARMLVKHCK